MEARCPKCNSIFILTDADKWLVKRSIENNLISIGISCTKCHKKIEIDPNERLKSPQYKGLSINDLPHDINIENEECELRYRCEQTVITKINDIPTNTTDIKREYIVEKSMIGDKLILTVKLVDNIVAVNPSQYEEALKLAADLDFARIDDIQIQSNSVTGEINGILNMQRVKQNWQKHKEALTDKYLYIEGREGKAAIKNFIEIAEERILTESLLVEDLSSNLFFYALFNKYLVKDRGELIEPYSQTFYSQLFPGERLSLQMQQQVLSETPIEILLRKVSSKINSTEIQRRFEKFYNEKYQPIAGYKFSEYSASYRERSVYNTENRYLKEAHISIIEEIKNNIQVLITNTIRKID